VRADDDLSLRRMRDIGGGGGLSESRTPLGAAAAELASRPSSPARLPVLILMPKAVIKNWERELALWGWFCVRQLGGDGQSRAARSELLRDVEVRDI
jgi:hypothetical protein